MNTATDGRYARQEEFSMLEWTRTQHRTDQLPCSCAKCTNQFTLMPLCKHSLQIKVCILQCSMGEWTCTQHRTDYHLSWSVFSGQCAHCGIQWGIEKHWNTGSPLQGTIEITEQTFLGKDLFIQKESVHPPGNGILLCLLDTNSWYSSYMRHTN